MPRSEDRGSFTMVIEVARADWPSLAHETEPREAPEPTPIAGLPTAVNPEGMTDEALTLALMRGEPWAERVAGEWATPEEFPLASASRRLLLAARLGREAVRATTGAADGGGARTGMHLAYRAAIHLEAALCTLDAGRRHG